MQSNASLLARAFTVIAVFAALTHPIACAAGSGESAAVQRVHALSLLGTPKVPKDFSHFDWVRSDAPKGGPLQMRALGTFDTLNQFAPRALPASELGLLQSGLMIASLDEPSTQYCLIAEWVSHPADYSSATFGLRPQARFSDGKPVTSDDVVFTLDALKKANPRYAYYYKNVVKAEAIGPHEVRFVFDGPGNRELPLIVGSLPVLAKHYWTGKNEKGEQRDLSQGTLEPPVGAGPYQVSRFEPGRDITYARIEDWWAKDLPVARGQYNFNTIKMIYYRDRLPAFEAFKAGETDLWPENSAKGWATEFDFDAARRGLVKREELPDGNIKSMQGFVFNLRRSKFADRRVRYAFNLAFNYEWANKAMFFEQYRRSSSYFGNSELACSGYPKGEELAILESVAKDLPEEVFKDAFANPVNKSPADYRAHLGMAAKLLRDAGWTIENSLRTNGKGETLSVEVLLVQPAFERLVLAYKAELAKLGILVTVRVVDSAQYRRRVQSFDFDMIVHSFPQSHSPGNEQREFWGSAAADQEGAYNLMGIKNPAIDAIIERIIYAKDRSSLVAATRALDRTLMWGHYLVPQFHASFHRLAYWTKFARPAQLPSIAMPDDAVIRTWWYDDTAAVKLAFDRKN